VRTNMKFEQIIARVRQNLTVWQETCDTARALSGLQIKAAVRDCLFDAPTPPDAVTLRHLAAALVDGDTELTPYTVKNERALAFLDALLELYPDPLTEEQISIPLPLPEGPVTVAYFNSATFADSLTHFTPLIGEMTALPTESFTQAAEVVSNGKATFALLPIEDDAEGKLTRFYEQIDRFELHVIAALHIYTGRDGNQVRVALVGKNALALDSKEKPHAMECLLFEEDRHSLTTLLDAANAIGLALRRIDSLPISYRDGGFSKHLVFEGSAGLCQRLHAYLALFMPRTSVTADYLLL